ncbi:MAG: hypothetical protein ACI9XP_000994 [Lentimonas sp.]|jgi:hypothetical protein
MKIYGLFLIAATSLVLASCGGADSAAEELVVAPEMATLSVDKESSVLMWKGMKNAEYFHTGEIRFSKGQVMFVDGNLAGGGFTVDMSTILTTDPNLPENKQLVLTKHLSSADFFNIEKNQTAQIKLGSLDGGLVPTTLVFMGQSLTQNLPLEIIYTDEGASINGEFDFDFTKLMVPGFQPQEGQSESIQPVISFQLDMKLK